jgi:peroxiredoxin Q/BCP
MARIEPGKKAPAFALPDQTGALRRLSDYAGKTVVLFFYPKDDTPGCTAEACSLRDHAAELAREKAVVLGISILDAKSKAKFAKKFDLPYPLLADEDHAVAEKYGVWVEKSMYGRKYWGVARVTYVIGPQGKVVHRFDEVDTARHAEEVLAVLARA